MFKMGFYDPFEYLKHKLWPKEGMGIKVSRVSILGITFGRNPMANHRKYYKGEGGGFPMI